MRLQTSLAAIVALVLVAVAPEASGGGGTPITSCGQTVTTSAFLTGDLSCGSTSGVVIGADGITIDLKGFTLQGDSSSNHYGIDDNGFDRVTIKNGVVRTFSFGVHAINGADGVTVSDLIASGNTIDGIDIAGDSAKIKSSTVSGSSMNGIEVAGASARIQSTTAPENSGRGIYVVGNAASVTASTVAANGIYGMVIVGNSAKVEKSAALGNFAHGIDVIGDSATVSKTTAAGNLQYGIYVEGEGAVIKGNQASANGFDPSGGSDLAGLGIYVLDFTTTAPIGTNVAHGNDDPAECDPSSLC